METLEQLKYDSTMLRGQIVELKDEIERLRSLAYHKGGTTYQSMFVCTLDAMDENERLKRVVDGYAEALRGCKNVGQRIMATEMDRLPQYRCDGNVSRVHELHHIIDDAIQAAEKECAK